MIPYRILGVYKPARWSARQIGRDLCNLTREAGLRPHVDPAHGPLENVAWRSESLHAEVRRRSFRTKQAEGWHQDGDLTAGAKMDCGIVLWASNNPTQIKHHDYLKNEEILGAECIYQPEPFEVVLFSNAQCYHRRPPDVPRIRWVFRQRVKT